MTPPAERPGALPRDAFVARFGGVYEHSPWVAGAVRDSGTVPDDAEGLAAAMADVVEAAGEAAQLALLRAHPDLAGKLAVRGGLTPESGTEQASAGLDRCTPAEFAEFQRLNEAYRARFGFGMQDVHDAPPAPAPQFFVTGFARAASVAASRTASMPR